MVGQKLNYLDVTNCIEVALYILSLLVTLNFAEYSIDDGFRLLVSDSIVDGLNISALNNFQEDTGLRQVNL